MNFNSTGTSYGICGEVQSVSGYSGFSGAEGFIFRGNTGIGTAEPSAKLEVAGQVKITAGNPGNGKVLTSDASWQVPAISPWSVNGNNLYYNSGYVGIGTSSPGAGLHIKANGWTGSFMYFEANSGEDAGMRLYEGSAVKWHIHNDAGVDKTRQVGFSAQEVSAVLPELASKGEDGYLSVEYGKMTP